MRLFSRGLGVFVALSLSVALGLGAAQAQDVETMTFGSDYFAAGDYVSVEGANVADAFVAAQKVTTGTALSGNGHFLGRNININDPVGGSVYAAGQDISVGAAIRGNATLFGQSLDVSEPISGNLRAFGQTITIDAPIAGSAMIYGQTVIIAADILGDLKVQAGEVEIKEGVSIGGVQDIQIEEDTFADDPAVDVQIYEEEAKPSWILGLLKSIAISTFFVALYAVLAPNKAGLTNADIFAAPTRMAWRGFLTLAMIFGTIVVLILSILGLLVVPFFILAAFIVAWIGYLAAVYALGTAVIERFVDHSSESTLDRVIAAFTGVVIASIIVALPYLGFFAWWALVLVGLGAFVWPWLARKARISQS